MSSALGGNYDKSKGYFIEPTLIETTNPKYATMSTELFGPVMTVYVYEDDAFEATLKLVDDTSEYAWFWSNEIGQCDVGNF